MKKKKLKLFKIGVRRRPLARKVVASLQRQGIRAGRWGKRVFVEAFDKDKAKRLVAREVQTWARE